MVAEVNRIFSGHSHVSWLEISGVSRKISDFITIKLSHPYTKLWPMIESEYQPRGGG
jgi:hypothetical protein